MTKETLKQTLCEISNKILVNGELAAGDKADLAEAPRMDTEGNASSSNTLPNETEAFKIKIQELMDKNNELTNLIIKQQESVNTLIQGQATTAATLQTLTSNVGKIMTSMDIDDNDDDLGPDDTEAEPRDSLVIGDSIVRDMESTAEDLSIKWTNGAMLCNVRKSLKATKPRQKFKDITIVCGTNDAATNKPNENIIKDCEKLLQLAKERAVNVQVSSILPRLDEKVPDNKMEDLNSRLKTACEERGAVFINNDLSFKYADGSVDDSLLQPVDKLHLSHQETKRLLRNLSLDKKAKVTVHKTAEKSPSWTAQNRSILEDTSNPLPVPSEPRPLTQIQSSSTNTKNIVKFRGPRSPFSNFYMTPIEAWGMHFRSTEHGYAYYKAVAMHEPEKAKEILVAPNARSAKIIGDKVTTNQQWQEDKKSVMYYLLQQKAKQCRKFNKELQATQEQVLIEDTNHEYWGRGNNGNGQNVLGRLLMTIRQNLPACQEEEDVNQGKAFRNVSPRNELPNTRRHQHNRQRFTPLPEVAPRRWTNGRNRPTSSQEQQNCFNCGERSHTVATCRHPYPLKCYSCSGEGHKQKFCPWQDCSY